MMTSTYFLMPADDRQIRLNRLCGLIELRLTNADDQAAVTLDPAEALELAEVLAAFGRSDAER